MSIGGLYKLHDLEPDLLVLGKAIAMGMEFLQLWKEKYNTKKLKSHLLAAVIGLKEQAMLLRLELLINLRKNAIKYLIDRGHYFDKK